MDLGQDVDKPILSLLSVLGPTQTITNLEKRPGAMQLAHFDWRRFQVATNHHPSQLCDFQVLIDMRG